MIIIPPLVLEITACFHVCVSSDHFVSRGVGVEVHLKTPLFGKPAHTWMTLRLSAHVAPCAPDRVTEKQVDWALICSLNVCKIRSLLYRNGSESISRLMFMGKWRLSRWLEPLQGKVTAFTVKSSMQLCIILRLDRPEQRALKSNPAESSSKHDKSPLHDERMLLQMEHVAVLLC